MTDARERLEALLRVVDDAERENESVGVDDWYARAALLGALQTCRRAAQAALDAMPEDEGWIDAGEFNTCQNPQECDAGLVARTVKTVYRVNNMEPNTYRAKIKPVEGREDG
jgi:hypothetical protein